MTKVLLMVGTVVLSVSHARASAPAGRYTVEAWQENCNPVTLELQVGPGPLKATDFVLRPATE